MTLPNDRTPSRTHMAALALAALAGLSSAQTTWYVDDDHPNDPTPGASGLGFPFSNPSEDGSAGAPFDDIQKAIDAALDGDTVLVLPSNFFGYHALTTTFGSLDFRGKELTVRSSGGPLVTAIDGSLLGGQSGVVIDGSGPGTVFEGFTIQNCDAGSADGDNGGGLSVVGSSATVRNCRFLANAAHRGAGAHVIGSDARFEDCLFLGNTADHQGGGVHAGPGSPSFLRCTFDSNVSAYGGGALIRTVPNDVIEVDECSFVDNESLVDYGGGLGKFDQGSIFVRRTQFVGNVAAGRGGGAQINGPAWIEGCVFNGNSSSLGALNTDGGGNAVNGITSVLGSTFTQNVGGAATETEGLLLLVNCLVWNNLGFELGAGVGANHCDVLGGWPGTGNLDADPLFTDPLGADGTLGTADDDLSLLAGSPCIDAGDTLQLNGTAYPVDFAGRRRAVDDPATPDTGIVSIWLTTDIGAFEYQPPAPNSRPKNLTLTWQQP